MDGRQSSGIRRKGWISWLFLMAAAVAAAGEPPGETPKRRNVETSKAADEGAAASRPQAATQEERESRRQKAQRAREATRRRSAEQRERLRQAVKRGAQRGLPSEPLARNRALTALRREMDAALKCDACGGTGRFTSFRQHVRTGDVESGELRRRTCPQCGGRKKFPGAEWLRLFGDYTACTRGDDAGRGADPRIAGMATLRGAAAMMVVNREAEHRLRTRREREGESMLLVLEVRNIGAHVDDENNETPVIIGRLCGVARAPQLHIVTDHVPDAATEGRVVKMCVWIESAAVYRDRLDYDEQTWVATLEVAERWLDD